MSMKPIIQISLPVALSEAEVAFITRRAQEDYSYADIAISLDAESHQPRVKGVKRNGADLGNYNGDADYPVIALWTGMQLTLNAAMRELRKCNK